MQREMPSVVKTFWIASLVVFGSTLLVAWLEYRAHYSWQRVDPWADPLFADLVEYVPTFRLLHSVAFYYPAVSPVAYPPFAVVLLGMIYGTGHPVAAYLLLATILLAAALWTVRRALLHAGMTSPKAVLFPLTVLLVSFPIERLIHQGNVELFLWAFAATGIALFLRRLDLWASVFWGLAAAVKLYPIIFLILFLPRRKTRALLLGLITFITASLLSMKWMGPTVYAAWQGSLRNVFGYQGQRVSEWTLHELAANHSAFMLVKFAAVLHGNVAAHLIKGYYAAGIVLFLAAFFGRLCRLPVINQLLGVTVFMVLLPPISYYHTLVHLYAPVLMLIVLALRTTTEIKGLKLTLMLFLPLFASFTLLTFPSLLLFCGLAQAVVLLGLFGCALRYPFTGSSTLPM